VQLLERERERECVCVFVCVMAGCRRVGMGNVEAQCDTQYPFLCQFGLVFSCRAHLNLGVLALLLQLQLRVKR
jgi:hypothetical protein